MRRELTIRLLIVGADEAAEKHLIENVRRLAAMTAADKPAVLEVASAWREEVLPAEPTAETET